MNVVIYRSPWEVIIENVKGSDKLEISKLLWK